MLARSESSHEDIPLNTTSLSTSSLLRADANFPLHSFASLATTAEATSKPFTPSAARIILTKPNASSDFQAAPLLTKVGGVSARLSTRGFGREAFKTKFDAN